MASPGGSGDDVATKGTRLIRQFSFRELIKECIPGDLFDIRKRHHRKGSDDDGEEDEEEEEEGDAKQLRESIAKQISFEELQMMVTERWPEYFAKIPDSPELQGHVAYVYSILNQKYMLLLRHVNAECIKGLKEIEEEMKEHQSALTKLVSDETSKAEEIRDARHTARKLRQIEGQKRKLEDKEKRLKTGEKKKKLANGERKHSSDEDEDDSSFDEDKGGSSSSSSSSSSKSSGSE